MTSRGPACSERREPEASHAAAEELPAIAEVAGQEDDEEDLRELAGLERHGPELDPEGGAVDRGAEPGDRRQQEEHDRPQAEDVLDAVELAVVADQDRARGEDGHADDEPEPLAQREVGVDAVDHGQPDPRQERDQRHHVRVGVRENRAGHEVRCHVQAEEEGEVRQRLCGEDGLLRDEDAGKAEPGQDPDAEEVEELAVTKAHGFIVFPVERAGRALRPRPRPAEGADAQGRPRWPNPCI